MQTRPWPPWLCLISLWLAWTLTVYGFQLLVVSRFQVQRPDYVLKWTSAYTWRNVLLAPPDEVGFYRSVHVAWDSGYYLSIATQGYDDLQRGFVETGTGEKVSGNYAFLPLYPLLIRALSVATGLFFPPSSAPIYAALLLSLLGTLGAMFALYDIVKQYGGSDEDGLRAAFYLLVFPTGFFLAQVYAEGLFIGLAFGCLALLKRKKWLLSALLAAAAALTRATGVGLTLAIAAAVLHEEWGRWRQERAFQADLIGKATCALVPLLVFSAWRLSPAGHNFMVVEKYMFWRQTMGVESSWAAWSQVVAGFAAGNPPRNAYYVLEFAGLFLGAASSLALLRRYTPLSLFGLFVLAVSLTSAVPQSMIRYMLTVPAIFVFLGGLGKNRLLDKVWLMVSLPLMAILLALFTFDMWVG